MDKLVYDAVNLFDGLSSCGSNSCFIKAPSGVGTNRACRCHQKSGVMLIIMARASSVQRTAKKLEAASAK